MKKIINAALIITLIAIVFYIAYNFEYLKGVIIQVSPSDEVIVNHPTTSIDELIKDKGLVTVLGITANYIEDPSAQGNLEIVEYQIVKDPTGEWKEGKDALVVRVKNTSGHSWITIHLFIETKDEAGELINLPPWSLDFQKEQGVSGESIIIVSSFGEGKLISARLPVKTAVCNFLIEIRGFKDY